MEEDENIENPHQTPEIERWVADLSPVEFLRSVQRYFLNRAAEAAAYNWTLDFALNEIKEAWTDSNPYGSQWRRKLTIEELKSMDVEDLRQLGFSSWDGSLTLIPLWAWNFIADGSELTSIFGEKKTKGVDDIDLDNRWGCIAYGFGELAPEEN